MLRVHVFRVARLDWSLKAVAFGIIGDLELARLVLGRRREGFGLFFVSTYCRSTQVKAFSNLFKVREQVGRIPPLRTDDVRPRFIVCRSAAVVDHSINTTSTSDQFPLSNRYTAIIEIGLRGCFNVPCIFEVVGNSRV